MSVADGAQRGATARPRWRVQFTEPRTTPPRIRKEVERFSPAHRADLDRAMKHSMSETRKPKRRAYDPPPSERKAPRLSPNPNDPWPQFVALGDPYEDGRLEHDGKTLYRDAIIMFTGPRRYKKWKRDGADDLMCNTLYYVPDNIDNPRLGNELPFLHARVDKNSATFSFHERVDVLDASIHSPALVNFARIWRDYQLSQQRGLTYPQREADDDQDSYAAREEPTIPPELYITSDEEERGEIPLSKVV